MSIRSLSAMSLAALVLGATPVAASPEAATAIVNMPYDNLAWETTPEGVDFAPLRGARFEEAYMAMVRLPPGTVSPPHVKSSAMHGMVLSGTMTHVSVHSVSEPQVELTAGSYYEIPANVPHVSSCISERPCVTFLYQDGKFDFVPVQVPDRQ